MKKVDEKELERINGGSATVGMVGAIIMAVTSVSIIISGIFKGYTNPRGCNE